MAAAVTYGILGKVVASLGAAVGAVKKTIKSPKTTEPHTDKTYPPVKGKHKDQSKIEDFIGSCQHNCNKPIRRCLFIFSCEAKNEWKKQRMKKLRKSTIWYHYHRKS